MWLYLSKFDTLDLLQSSFFLSNTIICPAPSTQHTIVIFFLQKGYSLCQIQSKTSLGKSTIGMIKKKIDQSKKNSKTGCFHKLLYCNKQAIMHQIATGRLNNAVQATKFIHNINPNPICPQSLKYTQDK